MHFNYVIMQHHSLVCVACTQRSVSVGARGRGRGRETVDAPNIVRKHVGEDYFFNSDLMGGRRASGRDGRERTARAHARTHVTTET